MNVLSHFGASKSPITNPNKSTYKNKKLQLNTPYDAKVLSPISPGAEVGPWPPGMCLCYGREMKGTEDFSLPQDGHPSPTWQWRIEQIICFVFLSGKPSEAF